MRIILKNFLLNIPAITVYPLQNRLFVIELHRLHDAFIH
jgi:hypothetical protein